MSRFTYELEPYGVGDRILTINYKVIQNEDDIVVDGNVDWQNGVSIFHSEHIEISDLKDIFDTVIKAVHDAQHVLKGSDGI